jgi:hypothetical protein
VSAFEVVRHTHLGAQEAFARLTDWPRHAEYIPLTTIQLTGLIRGDAGERFVARTRLGPFHLDDPMEVTYRQPPVAAEPGVCRVVKLGPVLQGWTVLTVTPSLEGCVVHWQEEARLRAVGGLLAWPNRVAGQRLFARLLDGLLSDPPPS